MKSFLLVLALTCFCFASGGDTITYTDDVKNLADGEPFYSDLHYHSMKDSIAKVVNGNLGNNNIASDAEIDLSKLDTAGVLRGDTLRNKKVNTDTVKTKVATADSTNSTAIKATRATVDSLKIRKIDSDSATIPIFKGNETHRDSAYFAGGLRGLRLYFPQADIDSLVGDVKTGGYLYVRSHTYGDPSTSGTSQPSLILRLRGNDNGILDFGEYATGGDYWLQVTDILTMATNYNLVLNPNGGKIGIGKKPTATLDVNGTVAATAFSGPLTGNAATATTATNQSGGTVAATTGTFSTGITIAGGSQLTTYLDTTFYDSLYDNTTYRARALCRIVQVGKNVTLYQPEMLGTLSGGDVFIKGIPSKFTGSVAFSGAVPVLANINASLGLMNNDGGNVISIKAATTASLASGTGGIRATCFSWMIN